MLGSCELTRYVMCNGFVANVLRCDNTWSYAAGTRGLGNVDGGGLILGLAAAIAVGLQAAFELSTSCVCLGSR